MASLIRMGVVAAVLIGWSSVVSPAFAQTALFVEHRGKMQPVIAARDRSPVVVEDGKRITVHTDKFAIGKVEEFCPAFVSVKDIEVRDSYLELSGGGDINHTFAFNADFESAYALTDVFVVLEFEFDRGEKSLFVHEVGDLAPRENRFIKLAAPLTQRLGTGKYVLHIFSGGQEVFHSQHPFFFRDFMLDQMIAKRIAGAPDANPRPFVGPPPVYPQKFKKSRIKGTAQLRFTVRTNGAVDNPTIVSTTDPAFGEAALDSIRMWRFLPRIKAGRPVKTTVDLPIEFEPPEKS